MARIVSSSTKIRFLDQAKLGALTVLFLGATLLFIVGFAGPQVIHDSAHDGRHSFSFPCH